MRASGEWKGMGLVVAMVTAGCAQPSSVLRGGSAGMRQAEAGPRITSTYQSELSGGGDRAVTLRVVASDPQGRALTLTWEAHSGSLGAPTQEGALSEVEWTPPRCVRADATPSVTATVRNAQGQSTATTFTLAGGAPCGARGGRARLLSLHSESALWNTR